MYNRQLSVFVCVADCGSFNKAAEKLFISSTAVMKQINSLESHLKLKLVERSHRGIRLTVAGESIYKDAKFLFSYSDKAIGRAQQLLSATSTTFCVGTSLLNPCKPFMDLWRQIDDEFPGYRLHIVPFEDDHNGILAEITALGVKYDFLVGVCDSSLWREQCNFLPLGEYPRGFAVPITHRLATKKMLTITDLYGETVMMIKRGDSPINDRERDEIEKNHPQIRIEDTPYFYDIGVFNHCVRTGSILSSILCWQDVHPSLVTIPMDWGHTIPYGLLYPFHPLDDILQVVEAIKALVP